MFLVLPGCSAQPAPSIVKVSAADYLTAFEAAKSTAHDFHFPLAYVDQRQGILETEPKIAASILEPWEIHEPSLDQSLENTLMHQRRRIRFEFWPITSSAQIPATAPDPLSLTGSTLDLTSSTDPLELRVFVYLERSDVPGQQRSTWTRSKSSRYTTGNPDEQGIHWTVVGQDSEYADQLLAHLSSLLSKRLAVEPAQ